MGKFAFVAGAVLAGLAVGLGAIGTHSLEQLLPQWFGDSQRRLDAWDSAVFWQAVHALALMAVGLADSRISARAQKSVTIMFIIATVLFSFCIYVWVLSGIAFLVAPVPFGGVLFMAGWVVLAISAMNFRESSTTTGKQ